VTGDFRRENIMRKLKTRSFELVTVIIVEFDNVDQPINNPF
jgi:hypothetical protein